MKKIFIVATIFTLFSAAWRYYGNDEATISQGLLVQSAVAQTPELNLDKYANSAKTIPISMSGFTGTAQEVLKFDLEVHGFEFVSADTAAFIVTGKSNGQVEGRLADKNKTIFSRAYTGGNTRSQAHTLANDIIFAITQRKGVTQSKIAFRVGEGRAAEIYVADYDGENRVAVTSDKVLVSAPTWVPGQRKLFYVSYKSGFPDILAHDLSTGARQKFANYGGGNYSPAVSPDGRRVAMVLSKTGNAELFVCNIDGSGLKQLTKTKESESSPCWSPNGDTICYVSGTRARLYKISADGGTAKQLVPAGAGGNLTEPDWSPDGKTIAFTSQTGKYFSICTVPAEGGSATVLVEGEDPAWGANSRTVIFTRRKSGGRVLSLLDVPTKRVKDVTRISGSSSQPSWAK